MWPVAGEAVLKASITEVPMLPTHRTVGVVGRRSPAAPNSSMRGLGPRARSLRATSDPVSCPRGLSWPLACRVNDQPVDCTVPYHASSSWSLEWYADRFALGGSTMSSQQAFGSSQIYGVPVVTVSGEIDIANADDLRAALARENGESTIVVSLHDVRYIDSSGLTVLIKEHRQRQARGERLLIVLPPAPVSRVFEITQLTDVLACFSELSDAIQHARADPSANGKSPAASGESARNGKLS
jgi:anti-sigma B factor antagonist